MNVARLSALRTACLYSQEYSFLLEVESTPGPQCDRKDYVNEKFNWHHRESIPRPSVNVTVVMINIVAFKGKVPGSLLWFRFAVLSRGCQLPRKQTVTLMTLNSRPDFNFPPDRVIFISFSGFNVCPSNTRFRFLSCICNLQAIPVSDAVIGCSA
jgi:hypothetical protein